MRKTILICAALLVAASIGFAQDAGKVSPPQPQQQQPPSGQQRPSQGMPPMMMPGMGFAMQTRTMIATSDGGVIVLSGNRLLKFDKDLNLVKEVKFEPDIPAFGMPPGPPPGGQNPPAAGAPPAQQK